MKFDKKPSSKGHIWRLLGKINYAVGNNYTIKGDLYTIYGWVSEVEKRNGWDGKDFDELKYSLTPGDKFDLIAALQNISQLFQETALTRKIKSQNYEVADISIYTDASDKGFGAYNNGNIFYGKLPDNILDKSSAARETCAAYLSINYYKKSLQNKIVNIFVDNSSLAYSINKEKSSRPQNRKYFTLLMEVCEAYNIKLQAAYVNTKDNPADAPSRIFNDDNDWVEEDEARTIENNREMFG